MILLQLPYVVFSFSSVCSKFVLRLHLDLWVFWGAQFHFQTFRNIYVIFLLLISSPILLLSANTVDVVLVLNDWNLLSGPGYMSWWFFAGSWGKWKWNLLLGGVLALLSFCNQVILSCSRQESSAPKYMLYESGDQCLDLWNSGMCWVGLPDSVETGNS